MKYIWCVALLVLSQPAFSAEEKAAPAPIAPEVAPAATAPSVTVEPKPKTRTLRLAPIFNVLIGTPFDTTARLGVGFKFNYEFIVSKHTFIGIHLAPRYFPATTASLVQLGYGVLIRHAFLQPEAKLRPYFEYGLLLQLSWFPGAQTGTGTSHDTRLCIGFDSKWSKKVPMFFEIAYDYSRLSYFGTTSQAVDRIEIDLGFEYSW